MATDTTTRPVTVDQSGKILITREDVIARLTERVMEIPETEGGDDTAILTALADAQTFDDINAPWQADGLRPYLGREVMIRGCRRIASDFPGGFGYFLALDLMDPETGETKVALTGATAIVAQLAAVQHAGGFPCYATPAEAKRATPGRTPAQHLDNVRPA